MLCLEMSAMATSSTSSICARYRMCVPAMPPAPMKATRSFFLGLAFFLAIPLLPYVTAV